jgi:hypothetical protein
MDDFDQLALRAANDVLDVEKDTPGQQDRTILAAAELVLRILKHDSRNLAPAPGDDARQLVDSRHVVRVEIGSDRGAGVH